MPIYSAFVRLYRGFTILMHISNGAVATFAERLGNVIEMHICRRKSVIASASVSN